MLRIRYKYLLLLAAVISISVAYYYIDPMTIWMPKCMIKQLTGYSCPACGTQRALHAVTHLYFGEAVKYNLFLLIGVPYILLIMFCDVIGYKYCSRITKFIKSKEVAYIYVGLFFAWWIVRNILDI